MAPPKSKRKSQRAGGSSGTYSDLYKQSASRTAAPMTASAATASAAAPAKEISMRSSDEVDWAGEYGYVLADLRYLGVVTAIIAGAIIVVGIFI